MIERDIMIQKQRLYYRYVYAYKKSMLLNHRIIFMKQDLRHLQWSSKEC